VNCPSLMKQQEEFEELALSKGAERFIKSLYGELSEEAVEVGVKKRSQQPLSRTQPGKRLILEHVDKVTARLRGLFTKEGKESLGTEATNSNPFLYAESMESIAFLAMKATIDFFARSVTRNEMSEAPRTKLINTLGNEILLELYANKARKSPSEELIAIEAALAHKKYGKDSEQGKCKEYLRKRKQRLFERMKNVDLANDPVLPVRVGLVIYHILHEEQVIDIRTISESNRKKTVMCRLAPAITEELRGRLDRWADDHPIWGPTVVPPRPWKKCRDGGYHFKLKNTLQIIKKHDDQIDMGTCPEVFDAVNRLQSTSYSINNYVLEVAQSIFARKDETEYAKLFKIKKEEETEYLEFKNKKSHPNSRDSIRMWMTVGVLKVLKEAERLKGYPEVYFVHTLDFRGRIYSKSTYLNPQGTDLCRGLIHFGNPKPIMDEQAAGWLANHGANSYGGELGRESYAARRNWIEENEARIRAVARSPLDNIEFLMQADSPWSFLAWSREWAAFLDAGMGYGSRLPVAVDGTCNGFQHFAALTRSAELGRNVNLLPSEKPNDIYGFVAESTAVGVNTLPEVKDYSTMSIKDMLRRYYRYLYRGNYIKKHDQEPKEEKYNFALDELESDDVARGERQANDNEPTDIVLEEANSSRTEKGVDGDDDFSQRDDAQSKTDFEKNLAALGVDKSTKTMDKKRKKKLLKCLQQCRNQLANTILHRLLQDPETGVELDRKLLKPVVMTFPYSATHSSNADAICDELTTRSLFSVMEKYYPNDTKYRAQSHRLEYILAHAITRFARKTINDKMPLASDVMKYLRDLPERDITKASITWRTPCGLTVCQYYPKLSEAKRKKLAYSDEVFYIRKLTTTTVADLSGHRKGISPNFVHSCDAAHLMKTVNSAFNNGITHFLAIHDSYSTHASDMEALSRILREEFVKMYEGNDLLELLRIALKRSKEKPFAANLQETFDIRQVMESDYFFS